MSDSYTIDDVRKNYDAAVLRITAEASRIVPKIINACFDEAGKGKKYFWLDDFEEFGVVSSEILQEIKSQMQSDGFIVEFAKDYFGDNNDKGLVIFGWTK